MQRRAFHANVADVAVAAGATKVDVADGSADTGVGVNVAEGVMLGGGGVEVGRDGVAVGAGDKDVHPKVAVPSETTASSVNAFQISLSIHSSRVDQARRMIAGKLLSAYILVPVATE